MKTQIIQLENYDDVISIKDKMGWSQTARILLELPSDFNILKRKLELLLIYRHSQSMGAKLGLVTSNRLTRLYAREIGIFVFDSIPKARRSRWRHNRGKYKRRFRLIVPETRSSDIEDTHQRIVDHRQKNLFNSKRLTRIGIFFLGVSAVFAIGSILAPSATIELTPTIIQESTTFNILAHDNIKTVSLSGSIPAVWKTVTVEGRSSIKTSGQASIPTRYSSGEVVFTNITDKTVTVPSGTIIRSSQFESKKYITIQDKRIPAYIGSSSKVQVKALNPGSAYDMSGSKIDIIEGPLGLNLAVTNPLPFSGGYDQTTASPTPTDYQRLYLQSFNLLLPTAQLEIINSLADGDIYPQTELVLNKIDQVSFDAEIGEPADILNLILRLEFKALIIQEKDILAVSEMVMDTKIRDGFTPVDGSTTFTSLGLVPEGDESTIHWRIRAERSLMSIINESQTIQESLGLRPSSALNILHDQLTINYPTKITISPNWWPLMPLLPFRISVINTSAQ